MSGTRAEITTNSRLSIRVTSLGGSAAVRSYCDPDCTGAALAVYLSNPCWTAVTSLSGSNWLPRALSIPERGSSGRQTGCGKDPSWTPPVTPVNREEVCVDSTGPKIKFPIPGFVKEMHWKFHLSWICPFTCPSSGNVKFSLTFPIEDRAEFPIEFPEMTEHVSLMCNAVSEI